MRAIIQRVTHANVQVNKEIVGSIHKGLLILLGVGQDDSQEDVIWLADKIRKMRIFSDKEGKMNLSVQDIGGACLVVSQFTLFASTKKGNRPSFIESARPEIAIPLYKRFVHYLSTQGIEVEEGIFGADMKLSLLNDGPVTIHIDSKNKQ